MRTVEQYYADLAAVMRKTFPDRDHDDEVGPDTRVFGDLGLASIDLVVLAEKLEQYYGRKLPFGTFLSGLRKQGANDVELGALTAFLQQHCP
jgi:acyl carrier protein